MIQLTTKVILAASVLNVLSFPAWAQSAPASSSAPLSQPWVLTPDMGYGYDKDGKTFSYRMGTSNAQVLLKGAKKVPKGTLFFIGENGQLYMRSGPFLDGGGKFLFGPG